MNDLEIEVKFYIDHVDEIRERILSLGAERTARTFETNIRFTDRAGSLARKKYLLRLRQDQKAVLTFKSTPPNADPGFKVHTELEVDVSDFELMARILKNLGFDPAQTYEKWRETFHMEGAVLCLDSLPYGDFLEIEGDTAAIRRSAHRLGLDWEHRIVWSYLEIFDLIRKQQSLAFTDVTFDHFASVSVDLCAYLGRIQIGPTV